MTRSAKDIDASPRGGSVRDAWPGTRTSTPEAQPGDWVAFAIASARVHRIGIHLGGDRMLPSLQSGDVVKEHEIGSSKTYFVRT